MVCVLDDEEESAQEGMERLKKQEPWRVLWSHD